MKAVIYTRVSSLTQSKEGNGLKGQEQACIDWCNKNNAEVVKIFADDGVSGRLSSRKGLDAMIEYIIQSNKRDKQIDCVVVYDLDRISRDMEGRFTISKKIEKLGKADIVTTKYKREKNAQGGLQDKIMMAFSSYRRDQNTERVIDRQMARLKDGYWPFTRIPGYQYIKDPTGGGKILILDVNYASIIAGGLEKFASRALRNNTDLLLYFEEKGVISIQRNKVNYQFIHRLLMPDRLLFYAGYINVPTWGIENQLGKHEPLITLETAEKIINLHIPKKMHVRNVREDIKHNMILRNYLYCSCCQKPLSGGPSLGSRGKKTYYYYRCFNIDCELTRKSFNADKVHAEFEKHINKYVLNIDFVEILKDTIKTIFSQDEDGQSRKEILQKDLEVLERKVKKINEKIIDTDSPLLATNYEEELKKLIGEKQVLEQEIINSSKNQISMAKGFEQIDNYVNNYKDLGKARKEGDDESKQLLIRVVMNGKIFYNEKSGVTTPEISLVYAAYEAFNESDLRLLEVTRLELVSKSHV